MSKNPLTNGKGASRQNQPCIPCDEQKGPEVNKTGRAGQEEDQFLVIGGKTKGKDDVGVLR